MACRIGLMLIAANCHYQLNYVQVPAEVATAVRNNGGGHWNHSFFWKVLTSPSNTNGPSAELKAAIDESFGSLDEMKTKFNQVCGYGSVCQALLCSCMPRILHHHIHKVACNDELQVNVDE